MSGWEAMRLDDLVAFRNGKSTKGQVEGEYPVFGSNGIIGSASKAMYENAIILGRVGAYCGSVAYCTGKFWATDNTIVVEAKADVLDVRFAQYLLRHANLNHYAAGSAQPLLTQTNLRGLQFSVPSVCKQRRIASILGAYDDLIEVNRRRVAVLEAMARGLFEEWFVRFRFPGHENHKIIDTPNGPLPEGWKNAPFSSVGDAQYGNMLPKKEMIETGKYPVYGASKIIGRHDRYTKAGRTIICGCRGSVGEFQISKPFSYITNNSFTIEPLEIGDYFWLFMALRHRGLNDIIGGSAQPQITLQGMATVNLPVPLRSIRQKYDVFTRSFFEQIWTLTDQNERLAATRDLLLPRLISGELSVAAAERELEVAA